MVIDRKLVLCVVGACVMLSSPVGAKTSISLMNPYGSGPYQTALDAMAKQYMKENPNIDVRVLADTWGLMDKIIIQSAAGTGPDLAIMPEDYVGKLTSGGLLENLDPYIKASRFPIANYYKATVDAHRSKYRNVPGQYGMPFIYSGYGFFFNKDMFARRGVAPPAKDWTYDDLRKLAVKLTVDLNNDGKIDEYALDISNHQNRMVGFIRSYGGDIVNEDTNELRLAEPASIAGLQCFGDMWAKYNAVFTGAFPTGKAALMMNTAFEIPDVRKAKFDWDVTEAPFGPTGLRSVCMPVAGISLTKVSKQKKEAWKFMQFLVSQDQQEYFGKLQLAIPANIKASRAWLNLEIRPKNAEVFIDSVKYAAPTGKAPYCDGIFEVLRRTARGMLANKDDANSMVAKAVPEMKAIIKKFLPRMSR